MLGPFAGLRIARAQRRYRKGDYVRLQSEQLRSLVRHAYDKVPFYRRLYDEAGLDPDSVRGLEDLEKIPTVSREDLQGRPVSETVAHGWDPADLKELKTSGSTGEPFVTRRDPAEGRVGGALRMEAYRRLGMSRRDKLAGVAYYPDVGKQRRPLLLRLLRLFGLYQGQLVHCLQQPEEIARQLIEGRPKVISGLPSVLSLLNETSRAKDLRKLGVRFVAPGGQVLTGAMRRAIEEAFQAPVYDFYAAYELGTVAWECAETHEFHTQDGSVISEVLDGDRPVATGEQGELVGTKMFVFSVPFIRYRLGDLVTRGREQCACGAPFGTIKEVVGRQHDYFTLPDGRMVHPCQIGIAAVADGFDWILRYQIVQERKDYVAMRTVARVRPTDEQMKQLETSMREALGPDVEFRSELVDDLGLQASGKFQSIISNVRSFYGGSAPKRPNGAP